jgi:glycerol-3-phosphate acyltransferase PlsY
VVALVTFGASFGLWKIVSLSSIAATIIVPMWALVTNAPDAVSISLMVVAAIIVMRHEQNIRRLIEGREPQFSSNSSGGPVS